MNSPLTKWDYRWLGLAKHISAWSKDPSTQVGAVIADGKRLISMGYNGFPTSCPDYPSLLHEREKKYKLVTHAEINAILNSQLPVKNCTVYTYPLGICASCASTLAAAGIKKVISQIEPRVSATQKYLNLDDTEYVLKMNNIAYYWDYVE